MRQLLSQIGICSLLMLPASVHAQEYVTPRDKFKYLTRHSRIEELETQTRYYHRREGFTFTLVDMKSDGYSHDDQLHIVREKPFEYAIDVGLDGMDRRDFFRFSIEEHSANTQMLSWQTREKMQNGMTHWNMQHDPTLSDYARETFEHLMQQNLREAHFVLRSVILLEREN